MANPRALAVAFWLSGACVEPPADSSTTGTEAPDSVASNSLTTCPSGGVVVPTSASASATQALIDGHPNGTTFCFASGEHTLLSPITLRQGDIIVGLGTAVIRAAATLTGWSKLSSTRWSTHVSGLTVPALVTASFINCPDSTDHCNYPDDVYYGEGPLQRVWSLAAQGAGQYYVDYASDTIYIGNDPASTPVYRAVPLPVVSGNGVGLFQSNPDKNTSISYLTIKMVGTAMDTGAINGQALKVDHVDISWSHSKGVATSHGGSITKSHLHQNGQAGMSANFDDPSILDNEVDHNNWVKCVGTCAGIKVTSVNGAVVRGNNIHDNEDQGLWADVGSINYTFDNNLIRNNTGIGISLEISYDGVVSNNTIDGNGFNAPGQFSGPKGAIVSTASGSCRCATARQPGIAIFGNVIGSVSGNALGIELFGASRGSGQFGTHLVQDVHVHDNTVTVTANSWTGAVDGRGDGVIYSAAAKNTFQSDTYHKDVAGPLWKWEFGGRTRLLDFAEWKAAGNDTAGTCSGMGC
jgi:parallel beta-helix repeat protein